MRFLLKFSLFLAIILAATSIILPRRYATSFPRDPGPQTDVQARFDDGAYLQENHPEIVLLGDSTLMLGVDPNLLAEKTGKSVYNMGKLGSASAMWYLLLKNNIVESSYKPAYVIVVFRNTILTAPGFRVQGNYFARLDEYARINEPLFIKNSFVNLMNPLEIAAEQYFPLYVFRHRIRETIDQKIRYLGTGLLGCHRECTDDALRDTTVAEDFEPQALEDALNSADNLLYTSGQLDFNARLEDSYLPELIRLTYENDIKIIFVRIKVESDPDSPALNDYLQDLSTYLEGNGSYYLDFGDDPRLTHDLFQDPIHLNEQGKNLFTELLANELTEIFARE